MLKDLIDKLDYLDHLIRIKGTGNVDELSKKMRISKRGVFNHITLLKELGAPIKFCRNQNSYYYAEDGEFRFVFKKNRLI